MDQILARRLRCLWGDRDDPSEIQILKEEEDDDDDGDGDDEDVNAAVEKYVYSMGEEEEEEEEEEDEEEEERRRRRRRRRRSRRRREDAAVEKYVNIMGEEEEQDEEEERIRRRRRRRKRRRRREEAAAKKYLNAVLQILRSVASDQIGKQKKLCEPPSQAHKYQDGAAHHKPSNSSSDDGAYHQGPNPVKTSKVSFLSITNTTTHAASSQKKSPHPRLTYCPLSNSSSDDGDDDNDDDDDDDDGDDEEEEEEEEDEDSDGLFIPEKFEIQFTAVKWINHYSSNHKILLVGEGDFSFSASLAAAFGSATNITATSLDSLGFLVRNYRRALSNIIKLKYYGAVVLHKVDATEMANLSPFKYMRRFDRVVYNFPLAGFFHNQSREDKIRQNRTFVERFLENAKKMSDISGEIHITHKCNGFFLEWDLEALASRVGLRLKEEVHFDLSDYPGYNTKYGFGGDKNFNCYPSKTYKFVHQNPVRLQDFM